MGSHIEAAMRPGAVSRGGFLGFGERLDDILKIDDDTVRGLGLTHEKIAKRIEYFIHAVDDHPTFIDLIYVGGRTVHGGRQQCPYGDAGMSMDHSETNIYVKNILTKEELQFPGHIAHLIAEHKFYGGRKSPYRVDPEKAARVLNIR